jgi:mxaL protein
LASFALAAALVMPTFDLPRDRVDAIAVLDITQSMNVLDATVDGRSVSRLEFAKQSLARAVSRLPCGSKIGLGVFTEYRMFVLFKPIETCANRDELVDSIEHVDGQMAWARSSQIAKALQFGLRTLARLDAPPALAFITDGHEAPPINAQYRLDLSDAGGRVKGLIAGVGGATPLAIPKFDPEGHPIGTWQADEVAQIDPYSRGRQGSTADEAMEQSRPAAPIPGALKGTPGSEHLSSLREPYLRLLAKDAGFIYGRLVTVDDLTRLLHSSLAERQVIATDLRWVAATVALLALVVPMAWIRLVRLAAFQNPELYQAQANAEKKSLYTMG